MGYEKTWSHVPSNGSQAIVGKTHTRFLNPTHPHAGNIYRRLASSGQTYAIFDSKFTIQKFENDYFIKCHCWGIIDRRRIDTTY